MVEESGVARAQDMRSLVAERASPVRFDLVETGAGGLTLFEGVRLEAVDVFQYEGIGVWRTSRSLHHIRADHASEYYVSIPLHARITVARCGTATEVLPGSFVLIPTARPFDIAVSATRHDERYSCIHVRIANSLLRHKLPQIDDCCYQPIAIRVGSGRIMRGILDLAIAEAGCLSQQGAQQFSGMLVDAVAHAVGDAPGVSDRSRIRGAHARIVDQARRCVEEHLADPDLDPDFVARHCRISARYLRAAFESHGDTLSAYIRVSRLQHCRTALRMPALARRSIAQIAASWGFDDQAYFSRAYKERFGRTPREERKTIGESQASPG